MGSVEVSGEPNDVAKTRSQLSIAAADGINNEFITRCGALFDIDNERIALS